MKRIALCIGNDEYLNMDPLECAINDAESMAKVLTELGFETICKCNLNRTDMVETITDFIDNLENYDSCLFYYAGHGFQIEGENILAPTDLKLDGKKSAIKFYAYPLEDLMRSLDKYPNKTKVFVFDACRTALNSRGTIRSFAPLLAPQGSIIAFATSPGQSSGEDKTLKHGYYTSALLQYISLPRVSVETVFKKTREKLVSQFGEKQIPWEHTSLIGEYYLNPNTIYDGVNYSPDALADCRYHAMDNEAKKIIDALKSHNWYIQGPALSLISSLNFETISASDLFVIGRNIYQAADGSCFDAQIYIDEFAGKNLPEKAKMHILNGMSYEIYFSSENVLRLHPKTGYYNSVIQLLENESYYGSKLFISSVLCKYEKQVLYIPGQNEIMEFWVNCNDKGEVCSLIYKGQNVLYDTEGNSIENSSIDTWELTNEQVVNSIACQVVAPNDCVRVMGLEKDCIMFPFKFTIRRIKD